MTTQKTAKIGRSAVLGPRAAAVEPLKPAIRLLRERHQGFELLPAGAKTASKPLPGLRKPFAAVFTPVILPPRVLIAAFWLYLAVKNVLLAVNQREKTAIQTLSPSSGGLPISSKRLLAVNLISLQGREAFHAKREAFPAGQDSRHIANSSQSGTPKTVSVSCTTWSPR